jgi:signal transduction histidine kinase
MSRSAPLRGLHARIIALVAVAAAVPTALVGVQAVRRARRDIEREVTRGNLALVRALGAGLDGTLQDGERALGLAAGAWADGARDDPEATRRLLNRLKRDLPLTRAVAVLDPDGRTISGDPLPSAPLARGGNYGGYVSEVFRSARDGSPCAYVVSQARGRTGELAGYLVAEVDLSFIGQTLASARLGPGARLWVVDASGAPVGWSGSAAAPSDLPAAAVVERALAAAGEGSLEAQGRLAVFQNLSAFQTVRGIDWAIILEQPTREAYALAAKTTRDTILVGVLVLVLAISLAAAFASRLARPLVQLAASVDAVAEGADAAGPALPLDAPGEIGVLARRFAEMARRVGERDSLKTALMRGEKLATVGVLAAGVAHEINNPLTTILGYSNLLLEDKAADHRDRPGLQLITDEARRVQGIVRTLLDHARAETGPVRLEPVDVNALIERTALLVRPTLKRRGARLTLTLAPDLPRPDGQPGRLEQVFVNLAQNAAHALEERGGSLHIRTAARGADVTVEFVDDGPGIAPEHLEAIFEPFFTTKGPGSGTGLGLAISRQIIADQGGRIEVESQVGHGATFRVVLPPRGGSDGAARRPPKMTTSPGTPTVAVKTRPETT